MKNNLKCVLGARIVTSTAMLAIGACAAAASAQSIVALPPIGGVSSQFTNPRGISDDGTRVAGSYERAGGGGATSAFSWTSAGGSQTLPALTGETQSRAWGLSGNGSTVVGWSKVGTSQKAIRWTSSGGAQDIGSLGGPISEANGTNADGSVVVGNSMSADGVRAFRWTSSGGMQNLGTVAGTGSWSKANAVSADGTTVIGQYTIHGIGQTAFRWTAQGGMQSLGYLGQVGQGSLANGVSADGSVIVGHSAGSAFRWTVSGGMQRLQGLAGGSGSNYAYAVSGNGAIVVGSADIGMNSAAVIWTPGNAAVRLQDLLAANGTDLSGWNSLWSVTAISADGRWVTGYGFYNGAVAGFVANLGAVVPAPGAVALLGVAGLAGSRRRRA